MISSVWSSRFHGLERVVRDHYMIIIGALWLLHAALGLFLPIYVDELVYKLALGRFFFENAQQLSIFPQCPVTFVSPVPLPLVPGAAIVAGAWQHLGLLGMRASGLLFIAVWLGLVWLILGRLTSPRGRTAALSAIVLFLSFGVTTYAMLLSRPDQFLVLTVTVLVAIPVLTESEPHAASARSVPRLVAIGVLYCLVLSLAAFAHPNLVYFSPVVVASIYWTFRPAGRVPAAIGVVAALGLVALGLQNSIRVLANCDDPAIRSMAAMRLVDLRGLLTAPVETLWQLTLNALTGFNGLLRNAGFAGTYQASWLPPTPLLGGAFGETVSLVLRIVWQAALVTAIVVGLYRLWRRSAPFAPLLLAGALLVSLAGLAAHSRSLNFTLIELIVPLVLLFCTLVLAPCADRVLDSRWRRPLVVLLGSLSVCSILLCFALIVPQLVWSSLSGRLFNDKQHHSYSAWNAGTRKATTIRLAAACGIQPGQAPDLVIDDVSYMTFRKDLRPMYATYINPSMMGAALSGRLPQFLLDKQGSGFIGKCNYLPYELQSVAIRDGEACCVNRAGLEKAAQASPK